MKIRHIAIFLILLVCLVGAVSAADDVAVDTLDVADGDAVAVDNVQEEVSEDVSTEPADTAADDTLQATNETIQTTTNEENLKEQNNYETLKDGNKIVTVSDLDSLTAEINNAINDNEHDEYIINLNQGSYSSSKAVVFSSTNIMKPVLIINGSGQGLPRLTFNFEGNIVIINASVSATISNANISLYDSIQLGDLKITSCKAYINNSSLRNRIQNFGTLIIEEGCTYTNKFTLSYGTTDTSTTIINDINILNYLKTKGFYFGENIIEDTTISSKITNKGNLTIKNSIINAEIDNSRGALNISDDTTFGANCFIRGDGNIIINDVNRIAPYLQNHYEDVTIENSNIINEKNNYANITIVNSNITKKISNYGTIHFKNSNIKQIIDNFGTLIFDDDVIFSGSAQIRISEQSKIIINDLNRIAPYWNIYDGNYTFENITNNVAQENKGNLILINSNINKKITNSGTLNIVNSNITIAIINDGSLIINGSSVVKKSYAFQFVNNGNLILENSILNTNQQFDNKGTLTIRNSTIYDNIKNSGTLILEGNVTLVGTIKISETGTIIADDINKYFKYIDEFTGETIIELKDYNNAIYNSGKLTIENSTLISSYSINRVGGILVIKNTTINGWTNDGIMEFYNATINNKISNSGTLIISDDTKFGENFQITGNGEIIINNPQRVADFLNTYTGNIILNNKTINAPKVNQGNLTLNKCTIDSTIENNGCIFIDDDTNFGANGGITGNGIIVTNNITRLLPYISVINGNHIITDTILTKSYTFAGEVTLKNCTISNPNNLNFGILNLINCTINVGTENIFLDNFGVVNNNTDIIGITNNFVKINPDNTYTYIVNNNTINNIFENNKLNSFIKPGSTLDVQGLIKLQHSLIINKPVNIISSTKDGYIDLNTTGGSYFGEDPGNSFIINKDGAYSNITGIYFHNTQLWIYNTHDIILNNISAVVENQRVGSGVGHTSIRENSSYITVKNSYFYTKDNEGSSTLVLAWADHCTIENNTVEGDGFIGNLIYLTTYNVNIPQDIIYNSNNKIINNRLRGPETSSATCFAICISGYDNLVDNNTINYCGSGIMFQWGSGITGIETPGNESLVGSGENIICNNKLYGGCGISAGNIVYNNYMEGQFFVSSAKAYNNTANNLIIGEGVTEITNNTINGPVTIRGADRPYSLIANNKIGGRIEIQSSVVNITLQSNNITGDIRLDGSFNNIINNRITTDEEYTIFSTRFGVNNTISGNHLVAKNRDGDDSVYLRDSSNTITDNTPMSSKIELTAPTQATVNKEVQVTINLMDKNGNPVNAAQVTVTSSAGSETVNITNGIGVYQYIPKTIGQDTVKVSFAGNANLYLSNNSATINVVAEPAKQNQTGNTTPQKPSSDKTPVVNKKATKIVAKKKTFKAKTKVKKYTITLKAGKKLLSKVKVTLKIKGKTYKATTNAKGKATFKIKKLTKKGKYTATIKFAGNKNYKATSVKVKITVKK